MRFFSLLPERVSHDGYFLQSGQGSARRAACTTTKNSDNNNQIKPNQSESRLGDKTHKRDTFCLVGKSFPEAQRVKQNRSATATHTETHTEKKRELNRKLALDSIILR